MESYLIAHGFSEVSSIPQKDLESSYFWEFRATFSQVLYFVKAYKSSLEYSRICAERESTCCSLLPNSSILALRSTWKDSVSGDSFSFLCFDGFKGQLKDSILTRAANQAFWPEPELWAFMQAMIWTGREMQQNEIAHRGISLKNIVKDSSGAYKLAGFHFAKQLNTAGSLSESWCGAVASQDAYFKRDVFDLGLVFLQMATLQVVIPAEFNPQRTVLEISRYSESLKNVLLMMLQRNNEARPSFLDLTSGWQSLGTVNCDHYPDETLHFVKSPCHGFRCQSCIEPSRDQQQYRCWCSQAWHPVPSNFLSLSGEMAPCLHCCRLVPEDGFIQLPCGGVNHRYCSVDCFVQYVETASKNYRDFSLLKCAIDDTPIGLDFVQTHVSGEGRLQSAIRALCQVCLECRKTKNLVLLPCGHSMCKPCGKFYARYYDVSEVICPLDKIRIPTNVVLSFLSTWMKFTYKFLGIN